ncbi:hypothetical protein NRP93_000540 [Clostridium botulinum]|nr:hypothetical protein [Clostridium botulinum]
MCNERKGMEQILKGNSPLIYDGEGMAILLTYKCVKHDYITIYLVICCAIY